MKKPARIDGISWDTYYQQGSEPKDIPDINLLIGDIDFENTKAGVADLKKFIKYLVKCADYLESKKRD